MDKNTSFPEMALEPLEPGPIPWSDHLFFATLLKKKRRHQMTITATFAIGEVQTSPKGAKSAPLRSEGRPIVWQSEWTSVLWEPNSFGEDPGKDQGPRQNVCFAMERDCEVWAAWDDFEKRWTTRT